MHSELQTAQAKVRDLQQRLFGRKTERGRSIETRLRQREVSSAPGVSGVSGVRGQRPGSPGHARKRLPELPAQIEVVELDEPQCPACGAPLAAFPGTDDSEVVEIEVRAYRRISRRHRYRPTCRCGCDGHVTALRVAHQHQTATKKTTIATQANAAVADKLRREPLHEGERAKARLTTAIVMSAPAPPSMKPRLCNCELLWSAFSEGKVSAARLT